MTQERREITPEDITESLNALSSTPLGEALMKYVSIPSMWGEVTANRRALAEVLTNELESGNHARKVTAIETLLIAVDAKLHGVQMRADEAYFRTAPIGFENRLGSGKI